MELSERKQKILKAIVESYVANAEPVGSKAIAQSTDLGLSSATIRNEMAELTPHLRRAHPQPPGLSDLRQRADA